MTEPAELGVPLAPEGKQTVIVSFSLPYCIYLADDVYSVTTPEGIADVRLKKEWRVRDEEFSNAEIQNDPDGQYRFATMRMAFIVEPGDNVSDIALAVANRVVDVYRYVTGRAYLYPLRLHDLSDLVIERPDTGEGEVVVSFGATGLGIANPDDSHEVSAEVIEMLDSADPVPLHEEMLLTAARLLANGYTRQVVIECVSALQVFVEGVLLERLDLAGWAPEDIDTILEGNLGDAMKQPMESAIGWRPTEEPALWTDWLRVNGVRRRATHRGATVSVDEANEAIAVVRQLIEGISAHTSSPN